MLMVLAQKELIGHPGDVIANDNVPRFRLCKLFMRRRHGAARCQVISEKLFEAFHRTVAVLGDSRMIVNVSEQKVLEFRVVRCRGCAEAGEPFWGPPDVLCR